MESTTFTLLDIIPQILLPISLLASLSLPPFHFRGILCSTVIITLVYFCLTSPFPPPIPNTQARYGFLVAWFWYLPTLHKLLFTIPEESFWRLETNEKGQPIEREALNLHGWAKVRWAFALLANPRGVGWNFAIKGMPKAKFGRNEKAKFLSRQLRKFVVDYLFVEAGLMFVNTYSFPEVLDNGGLRWWDKAMVGVACAGVIRCSWEMQWVFVSLVGVGLGFSAPDEWPDFFGDITQCTSLAYFWGSYWQQVLKHSLLGVSHTLIRILHIPRPTFSSYTVHLTTGFLVSAIFHALTLIYLVPAPPPHLLCSNLIFFLAQVPAILVESWISSLFSSLELLEEEAEGKVHKASSMWRVCTRVVGYVWVVVMLGVTGWPFLEAYFRVGMAGWKVPFPVLKRICEGNEALCTFEFLDWEILGRL